MIGNGRRWQAFLLLALTVWLALPPGARGQTPTDDPIRMIVPYPPGGGTDGLARILVQRMTEHLGQRIIIENVAGAGGTIGSTRAANAAPDGHTLLMATLATHSIAPTLYPKLAYDVARDFTPIANFAYLTNYLVAGPSLTATDVADLIVRAKASPGAIKFASAGNGTAAHLAIEMFRLRTGVQLSHIPYKGGGPAITDLLGGHVDAIFGDPVSVLPHIAAGKLRALAFAGPRRSSALPEVPTAAEAGLKNFEVRVWHGVLAPAGIDPKTARRLADAVQAAAADPAIRASLEKIGAEPADEMLEEFGKVIAAERAKWGEVVTRAQVKID